MKEKYAVLRRKSVEKSFEMVCGQVKQVNVDYVWEVQGPLYYDLEEADNMALSYARDLHDEVMVMKLVNRYRVEHEVKLAQFADA